MSSENQRRPVTSDVNSPLARFLKKLPQAPFPSTPTNKRSDSRKVN